MKKRSKCPSWRSRRSLRELLRWPCVSQRLRHAYQRPGLLSSCRSGPRPLQDCPRSVYDRPGTRNLVDCLGACGFSKSPVPLPSCRGQISKIVEKTHKQRSEVIFPCDEPSIRTRTSTVRERSGMLWRDAASRTSFCCMSSATQVHAFLATPVNESVGTSVADVAPARPKSYVPVNANQLLQRFGLDRIR